jgi:hypothetical protein
MMVRRVPRQVELHIKNWIRFQYPQQRADAQVDSHKPVAKGCDRRLLIHLSPEPSHYGQSSISPPPGGQSLSFLGFSDSVTY